MNAGPPLPYQRCPGGDSTLHKLRRSSYKRFAGGHGVAEAVSGVEAAILDGDELLFGVGIEVSGRDPKLEC